MQAKADRNNFSPRFRDLDDQWFWRATMPGVETGTYGAVEDLARNRVNLNKVITHWPDTLKVAGSLVTNQARAYDLLRMFGRDGRPTPLGAAFAECGRIAKTEHLLWVVDPVDDTYRRQMNRQLTVQESRHKLARDVCHGKRGTIHQAYRDGMEDQLGALHLVLNAIVLWTTKHIDAAVEALRAEGHEIRDDDIVRLSPLKHRTPTLLGRYSSTASAPAAGALRPLRDPDAPEPDKEDEGGAGWPGSGADKGGRGLGQPLRSCSRPLPRSPRRDRGALDRPDVFDVEPLIAHLPNETDEPLQLRVGDRGLHDNGLAVRAFLTDAPVVSPLDQRVTTIFPRTCPFSEAAWAFAISSRG